MTNEDQIKDLEAELLDLQLPSFDAAVAWRIGCYMHDFAEARNKRIAFQVSRPGQQLFYCAMPGIAPDSTAWIRRKRNVVERFHKSSLLMKLLADRSTRSMHERYSLSPDDYCASGGGVPIAVSGSGCIGAVTVSGMTQYDDHALGVEALRAVLADMPTHH